MNILEIAIEIQKNGGRLYLVGGAIRDEILKREVHDKDYCITGLTVEEFNCLFPMAKKRGKSFPVFDIEGIEFALARREKKVTSGHKGFEFITGKEVSIEDDLSRRDITINSIAKDVLTNEIVDPYGGIKDIEKRVIRATTPAFSEDPLRVYRVARIASQLEFNVDKTTLEMMNVLKNELPTLSKERVFNEFKKALLTKKPSIFFNVLKDANVLQLHFKEIYDLIGSLQPMEYHPEGDSYNHTMIVTDKLAKKTDKTEVIYSGLVHDLGKGITPKKDYPHHHGHADKGVDLVKSLSDRIGVPEVWRKCGILACSEHMKGGRFYSMSPSKQVSFIEKVEGSFLGLSGLQLVVNTDRDRGIVDDRRYDFEELGKEMLDKINSAYVINKYNLKEGKIVGQRLHEERIKWLTERLKNN